MNFTLLKEEFCIPYFMHALWSCSTLIYLTYKFIGNNFLIHIELFLLHVLVSRFRALFNLSCLNLLSRIGFLYSRNINTFLSNYKLVRLDNFFFPWFGCKFIFNFNIDMIIKFFWPIFFYIFKCLFNSFVKRRSSFIV